MQAWTKFEKQNFIKNLPAWTRRTFEDLGGFEWSGFINAKTRSDLVILLDKHDEIRALNPEMLKLFNSLGGFEWKGFKRATSRGELTRLLGLAHKETDWPNWIERLSPEQRHMFERLGGTDWQSFKDAWCEEGLRGCLDYEIKELEASGWIARLSENDRSWFERLGGVAWDGYDESDTEEEFVNAIHDVIEETESAMVSIAKDYPLACEQRIKLMNYGLTEPQLKYALEVVEAKEILEHEQGKDLLFVLEIEQRSGTFSSFQIMTRQEYLFFFRISYETFTDFVNAGGEIDGHYEASSVDEVRMIASDLFKDGLISQESYDDIHTQLSHFLISKNKSAMS